ncbi:MAG: metal-dependent transcriptional regulator [Kiritimatiellae bacterium]|nr:metal-dependent transcriptional regulator [Kiritimatiellia bacterium]
MRKKQEQQMTQSLEDYLEAIYVIVKDGRNACVRDVARHLNVKMPSVVKAIHELKKMELVTQEPYGPILLTLKGKKLAGSVLNRHNLLRTFLEKLGVSKKNADKDACMMEHILSAETLDKIRDYISSSEESP